MIPSRGSGRFGRGLPRWRSSHEPRTSSVCPVHPARDDPADEPAGAERKDERKAKPVEIQIELEAAV